MSYRQQICLLAIFIPILYLSGLPSLWKGIAFVLVSIYLLAFAYRTRIETIVISEENFQAPTYTTASPAMPEHTDTSTETVVTPAPQDTADNANA